MIGSYLTLPDFPQTRQIGLLADLELGGWLELSFFPEI